MKILIFVLSGILALMGVGTLFAYSKSKNILYLIGGLIYLIGAIIAFKMISWIPLLIAFGLAWLLRILSKNREL